MDRIFVRNFFVFIVLLIISSGALFYNLYNGSKDLDKVDDLIIETYEVITQAEEMSASFEAMLSAQRGYLLTKENTFIEQYELEKSSISNLIAKMNEKLKERPSQQSRLEEIRNYFNEFSKTLEEASRLAEPHKGVQTLEDLDFIHQTKKDIARINNDLLKEQYSVLDIRIKQLEAERNQYFYTLLVSIVTSAILLLIFNSILLYAQRGKSKAEIALKYTEKRLQLAIEGTQDGIFDWDIKLNKVFYSKPFFTMLGYQDRGGDYSQVEDFTDLLHPDDKQGVEDYINSYLKGERSEYSQEFRMKSKSGRWVWIQARAQALFDSKGNAYRLVGAHSDITHLIKDKERLEKEKQAAEESSRAKTDFLAHMSHEIRTPLTAISGIAEILERTKDTLDNKQQKLIETLSSSSVTLKELINDILDFSKIESGEIDLEEEPFSADDLFEDIDNIMKLKASEKGISFLLDYKDIQSLPLMGDVKRTKQILINLIGNAIKFTDKGSVCIKAYIEEKNDNNALCIDIKDTGIGIKEENFDLIFERFKQADSTVSRRFGGTGLGLPISKRLANLMNGDLIVKSTFGEGSTFTLILPYTQQNEQQSIQVEANPEKVTDQIKQSMIEQHKALIVEDYEGNVVVVSYMLDELGIQYDSAANGKIALDLWENNHYDLVLMDVQMPEMDGFTATQEIRNLEKEKNLPRTPIIGMTAHALVGDKEKCVEVGMDSYLPKPIVEADFRKQVRNLLKIRKSA